MTIKSDRWIQEMALRHGMIEPFQAEQVRGGVISYGLSSYGYDMRVADEWKVFTNVHNTLVDPKHFDPRSFVDIKADHIDIPPNSFALARSVEYFRIPRRVLSVVLGKSTYARCFSADTRVALVGGGSAPLEELARHWERGTAFRGYCVGPGGKIISALLEAPRYIGRDSLIAVTLDNGRSIRCTPDHLFMLRDGTMAEAGTLRRGASLMPLYIDVAHGRGTVYQPLARHTPQARRAADWRNHTVSGIRELPGTHDVYCLTVPEAGNFALDAGVFVHNCGLIVNVTPLEPAWQGFVTIEISNTTPLPARVYANEGIAQVLFLESDEDCMISYADKAGKYQNQVGVVPPKM